MSPIDASNLDNIGEVAYILYSSDKQVGKIHFKLGDRVRVKSYRSIFTKGYKRRWRK